MRRTSHSKIAHSRAHQQHSALPSLLLGTLSKALHSAILLSKCQERSTWQGIQQLHHHTGIKAHWNQQWENMLYGKSPLLRELVQG